MTTSPSKLRELISVTHQHGVSIKTRIQALLRQEKALEAINRERYKLLAEANAHHGQPITMYDSIEVGTVPSSAVAVAGYVGGYWPTFASLVLRFPRAKHLSIAINAQENADCLDIENGDATPDEAPAWVRRQQKRGVRRPCLYASLSAMAAVMRALNDSGIKRSEVRLWVAWYVGRRILPHGFDACQYDDKALGRNLDVSVCSPTFFD